MLLLLPMLTIVLEMQELFSVLAFSFLIVNIDYQLMFNLLLAFLML